MTKTLTLISALTGLAIAAWTPFTFAPHVTSPTPKSAAFESEIKKLIEQLGHKDFKLREAAAKLLSQVGIPALNALEQAERATDVEISQRAIALHKQIRRANRLPAKVKGVEFKLIVDERKWLIPTAATHRQEFNIKLQITNMSPTAFRFFLHNNVDVVLINKDNEALFVDCYACENPKGPGGWAAAPNKLSAPLKQNESLTIRFDCGVYKSLFEGYIDFSCIQELSGTWARFSTASRLEEGRYEFGLVYWNNEAAKDGLAPCWAGRAEIYELISVSELKKARP